MKRFLTRFGRIIKTALGVMCGLCTLVYVVTAITEAEMRTMFTVLAIIFGLFTFLLLRKKKPKAEPVVSDLSQPAETGINISFAPQEVPEDILQDMRKCYTPMQAQDDMRIMLDSFKLCQQTTNFDTFISRLELGQRCALTLLQAHKAGCRVPDKKDIKTCDTLLASVTELKTAFLERTYIKETNAALLLKTPAGQHRRLEAYLTVLQEHEDDFMDVEDAYNKTLKDIQTLML